MAAATDASDVPLGWGSVGFFETRSESPFLFQLYSAGHETMTARDYRWDGMTRTDGPLYLFQYTVSGRGSLDIQGKTISLGPGALMILPIPDHHCYHIPADSPSWEYLYVLVRTDNFKPLWTLIQAHVGPVEWYGIDHPVLLCMKEIVRAVLSPEPRSPWQRSALVYELFTALMEASGSGAFPADQVPPGILRVKDALRRNFTEVLSLDAMADLSGMSKFHFLRQFKRCTGQTPGDYLSALRMEKAILLLQSGNHDLESIARICGFSGASYFIKVFRKHTGLTPGAFRERSSAADGTSLVWKQ